MGRKDPRIDAYIARQPEFARPILRALRQVVHSACPQGEESLKWGHPSFAYHGILCGMAAFKQHATFGFWKGKLIVDASGTRTPRWGSSGASPRWTTCRRSASWRAT
jgi:hypothetical protein